VLRDLFKEKDNKEKGKRKKKQKLGEERDNFLV